MNIFNCFKGKDQEIKEEVVTEIKEDIDVFSKKMTYHEKVDYILDYLDMNSQYYRNRMQPKLYAHSSYMLLATLGYKERPFDDRVNTNDYVYHDDNKCDICFNRYMGWDEQSMNDKYRDYG